MVTWQAMDGPSPMEMLRGWTAMLSSLMTTMGWSSIPSEAFVALVASWTPLATEKGVGLVLSCHRQ